MTRALLLLSLVSSVAHAQTFRRPVACDSCIGGWYYFDRNGAAAGQEDWNCAGSTYDGHRGSDFSLIGGAGAIDNGNDIVAAADGVVVSTQDGHYDRCTACGGANCGTDYGFGYGNHVVVNHGAYRVVYAHMRTGSVRVAMGATVRCGDVLGQIGSSGCSTGAHLHFETRPLGGASTTAFDPFAGPCSATSPSRWTSQGAHRSMPAPACDGMPPPPTCPTGTYSIWTCTSANQRRRCIDGNDMIEDCPWGCISMPVGTDDVCTTPPDADGDGSRADADCDDGNAARHPGANETCGDGVDQDCDGSDLACPMTDGGVTPIDAGASDAAPTAVDGSTAADGGSTPGLDGGPDDATTRRLIGGCACRAAPRSGPQWPLALLVLGLAWRRRR